VREACHALATEARQRIAALTGLEQICPDSPEWWRQMCTLPLPISGKAAGEALKQRLWEEYQIEVPITEWHDRLFVRVSIQAYNAPNDVDRLVDALARLL
ncbi:MAG TPA: aminotransferase, partial [Ktedonobacterales bacterium]